MNKVYLADDLAVSRITHGHWRLNEWKLDGQNLLRFIKELIEMGIDTFDHADIYGDYSCESIFGEALRLDPTLRSDITIITKCGIRFPSKNRPTNKMHRYDYSKEHILESVDNSLRNFNTTAIDLLLLHRPAPLFNPEEVASVFGELHKSGKVRHFGVSNFSPMQVDMLQSYCDQKLVTNQIEVSPFCLAQFENGTLDHGMLKRMPPMIWSPLSGGHLFQPQDDRQAEVVRALNEVASELDVEFIEQVAYAWLLHHPMNCIPIVGSGKVTRIKRAVDALDIQMTDDQWYKIYCAGITTPLP